MFSSLRRQRPPPNPQPATKKADWRNEGALTSPDAAEEDRRTVDDMTLLRHVTADGICANIRARFQPRESGNKRYPQIYTYIGHVLISVNPYLDTVDSWLYDSGTLERYPGRQRVQAPPHVFAVAEDAYRDLCDFRRDQCVIISGESGAGKTEAAKRVLQYITAVSGNHVFDGQHQDAVSGKILASSPILEAFGNAKTIRNHNSSRFGKYLEIVFGAEQQPIGARCTNYLLEKARVVSHSTGERTFHIFYQLCAGASDQERGDFCIYSAENYYCLNQGKSTHMQHIDDRQHYQDTKQAMTQMGISADDQYRIIQILSGIMWLGNVTFVESHENNQTSTRIESGEVLGMVAYLLGVDETSLADALTYRTMELEQSGRYTVYKIPLNQVQACAARDALGKFVYDALFNWIVAAINAALEVQADTSHLQSIGLLDIYGFEIFEQNSFEQLCINYVNEKLQQIFVELTLKSEQEEYVRENIKWTPIPFFNNKIVCELIEERRPPGVFSILNDVVATAHADTTDADRSFASRLNGCSSHPHFQQRGSKFLIKHYAGDVLYAIDGMAEKNKDALHNDLLEIMRYSQFGFLRDLFIANYEHLDSKGRRITAADRMKRSANELVDKLMKTRPSYVRCIKPNDNQAPYEFDTKRVMQQIQYLGLLENLRVRRAGFCHRQPFDSFIDRYFLVSQRTSYAGEYRWRGSALDGCICILKDAKIHPDEWQIGNTKIFIRHPETLWALEHLRTCYWHHMAGRIQRAYRNYQRRKLESTLLIQRAWRKWQLRKPLVELRHESAVVYGSRKQRRRFSTYDIRVFVGDYLGVRKGFFKMPIHGLNPQSVEFSAECQILVERFLRSPKLVPHYVLLANRHLVLANDLDGKILCRIPVEDLVGFSSSSSADDILVLHVKAEQPCGDLVVATLFKSELLTRLHRLVPLATISTLDLIEYRYGKGRKRRQLTFIPNPTKVEGWSLNKRVISIGQGQPATWKPVDHSKSAKTHHDRRPITQPRSRFASAPVVKSHEVYRAVYDFAASQADELSIDSGEKLIVLEKNSDGWWKAQILHNPARVGLVPHNYVEKTTEIFTEPVEPVAPVKIPARPPAFSPPSCEIPNVSASLESYADRPPSIVAPPPPVSPIIHQAPSPVKLRKASFDVSSPPPPPAMKKPITSNNAIVTLPYSSKQSEQPSVPKPPPFDNRPKILAAKPKHTKFFSTNSTPPLLSNKENTAGANVKSRPFTQPKESLVNTSIETSQDRIQELRKATQSNSIKDRIARLKTTDAEFEAGVLGKQQPWRLSTASAQSSAPPTPPPLTTKPRMVMPR